MAGMPAHERVVALDAEWDTESNSAGMVFKQHPVALIQLGYNEPGAGPRALLLQVRGKTLPMELLSIFSDTSITFTGRCVGNDIARIGSDFKCRDKIDVAARVDFDTIAKECGVVTSRSSTLELLAKKTLGVAMNKGPVRLSKWSAPTLSNEQVHYAALDVIVALRIHAVLLSLPDLTKRLSAAEATIGRKVAVLPPHGSRPASCSRANPAAPQPSSTSALTRFTRPTS